VRLIIVLSYQFYTGSAIVDYNGSDIYCVCARALTMEMFRSERENHKF